MIYDTFLFFNEMELLDVRLHELDGVVDRFVLVEATKTHANKSKPLFYAENQARFARFADKIIHVVIEDTPDTSNAWHIENFQRDCIRRGLSECQPQDIVLVSDLDEIPRADRVLEASRALRFDASPWSRALHAALKPRFVTAALRRFLKRRHPFVTVFEHTHYTYHLNWLCEGVRWHGTRMVFFRDLASANDLRRWRGATVPDGGWHFTWMGGVEGILQKVASTAHQELNTPQNRDPQRIDAHLNSGEHSGNLSIFGKTGTFKRVAIDETFPAYIRDNRALFDKWIKK